jgi:hypothetical protein
MSALFRPLESIDMTASCDSKYWPGWLVFRHQTMCGATSVSFLTARGMSSG